LQRLPILGSGADLSTSRTSSGQQVYHFTNSGSSDNARNVISELETLTLTNPFLLNGASNASKQGFTLDTEATIRRWDEL